jgi:hexosaminidase
MIIKSRKIILLLVLFGGLWMPVRTQQEIIRVNHLARGCSVKLVYAASPKYSNSSKNPLTDGIRGTLQMESGAWQGFRGNDLAGTLDLKKNIMVNEVRTGFIQGISARAFFPVKISVSVSNDGASFRTVESQEISGMTDDGIHDFSLKFAPVKARYIRVIATNRGTCPKGDPGEGEPAWILCDEIMVY